MGMGDDRSSARPGGLLGCPTYLLSQILREARRIYLELNRGVLRLPHLLVLAGLADYGPASQKQLSDRLRIDASDLVALLDELERHGLASRVRDTVDRRRYAVSITPAGTAELDSGLATTAVLHDQLFAGLNRQERDQLNHLLFRAYRHHDPGHVAPEPR